MTEPSGHHAHDQDRILIDHDRPADGLRIGIQPPPPEAVADDREVRDAGRVVLAVEGPAVGGRDTENGEVIPAHQHHLDALGRVAARHVRADRQETGDRGEQVGAGLIVDQFGGRDAGVGRAKAAQLAGDAHQLSGLGILERPQHDGVDDAEDGGAGADAEREREDDDRREARAIVQGSGGRIARREECASAEYTPYSSRNATTGSTRVARSAGI